MAFSEVASRKATAEFMGVDSASLALAGNVTSGNLIVAAGTWWTSPGTASATASGSLNTTGWTIYTNQLYTGSTSIFIAYRVSGSSGAETVSINPSGAEAWGSLSVNEYTSGGTIEFDAESGNGFEFSSGHPFVEITTTSATGLIVGVTGVEDTLYPNSMSITPGGSYTQFGEIESGVNAAHNALHRITSAVQLYTVDWTFGVTTHNSTAYGVAFKETGGGGGGSTARHGLLLGVGF